MNEIPRNDQMPCPHASWAVKERQGKKHDFCKTCDAHREHRYDDEPELPWETGPRPKKARSAKPKKAVAHYSAGPSPTRGKSVKLIVPIEGGTATLSFPQSPTIEDAERLCRVLGALGK